MLNKSFKLMSRIRQFDFPINLNIFNSSLKNSLIFKKNFASKNQEEMIDEILQSKSNSNSNPNSVKKSFNQSENSDLYPNTKSKANTSYGNFNNSYSENNNNNANNKENQNSSQNINIGDSNNNNNNEYNYQQKKRNRISIIRDGMNMQLYLKRPGPISIRNDSYVLLEIKEFKAEVKDEQRFIVLGGSNLCKLLLLDPKTCVKDEEKLDKIVIHQKNKIFSIEQNLDNTYYATIKIMKFENSSGNLFDKVIKDGNTKEENKAKSEPQVLIESQIELNPEDIVSMKIFAQASMLELLNFTS